MRDIYYPRGIITDRMLVAYYWVEGRDLHYWAPQCTGIMRGRTCSHYLCEKLNNATKYVYSLDNYHHEDGTITPIIKPPCVVVGDRCLVSMGNPLGGGYTRFLPLEAVEVLHLPVEREVPADALWEVVMMYSPDKLCTHLQLQGTHYTLCMDAPPEHQLQPGDARELVYAGTLDQCLSLNGYLKEAYRRGRMSAVRYVGKVCADIVRGAAPTRSNRDGY